MAPKYKLTYFDGRGLGETIRFMFYYGGVEFEDNRLDPNPNMDKEQWKAKTPFGQLPTLEIDGEVFTQSNAIGRYVARELGLYGKTALEKLQVDMIADTSADLNNHKIVWFTSEQDPERKKKINQTFTEEVAPRVLGKLDAIIAKNGGFTVGNTVTFSDFHLAVTVYNLRLVFTDVDYDKYTNVMALMDKVHNLPGVKEWVQRRPDTPF